MVDRELTPAHYERPSSDEPWRFECPDCGSISVDSLDRARVTGDEQFNFFCQGCNEKQVYVIDRQTDSPVYRWKKPDE